MIEKILRTIILLIVGTIIYNDFKEIKTEVIKRKVFKLKRWWYKENWKFILGLIAGMILMGAWVIFLKKTGL